MRFRVVVGYEFWLDIGCMSRVSWPWPSCPRETESYNDCTYFVFHVVEIVLMHFHACVVPRVVPVAEWQGQGNKIYWYN